MIVADTNLLAYLLIPGQHTALAEKVFIKDPEWAAPLLWRSEFRNVLALCLRRQGMTLRVAQAVMKKAGQVIGPREFSVPDDLVLEVVAHSTLSAYDAEFAVLAKELGVPLVTSDRELLGQAAKVARSPEAFAV